MRQTSLIGLFILGLLLTSCKDHKGFVVGRIKKASKLATVEFTIDKIVYGQKDKNLFWFIKLNQAQFIAHSKAHIKAGVDLEKLKADDVKIEGTRIKLTLPPVQVINFSYPAEEFSYDSINSSNAFLNSITLPDQERYFQEAETDIRNNLKNMDIVSITQRKTSIMLDNLLQALGYTEVFIDFHTGELIPEVKP
jgi:hypothetical protein